jgi:hypothetical protein
MIRLLCAAALLAATSAAQAADPPPPPIPPKPLRGTLTDLPLPPDAAAPPPPPAASPAAACAVTTDLLNLRTGPAYTYPVITALPPNAVVALLEPATGRWQHIATRLGVGWVLKVYIQSSQCPPDDDASR